MEQDFIKKDLLQSGIDVVVPDKADRELIAKRIYEELEFGIVKEATLKEFNDIIQNNRIIASLTYYYSYPKKRNFKFSPSNARFTGTNLSPYFLRSFYLCLCRDSRAALPKYLQRMNAFPY